MKIKKEQRGETLVIYLAGRLDAATTPELDKEIADSLTGVKELVFDLAKLDYIASAGLRTLLVAQKRMSKQGSMKLRNVCEDVKEVLDMTGFATFLKLE